jgi:hypothetical protein
MSNIVYNTTTIKEDGTVVINPEILPDGSRVIRVSSMEYNYIKSAVDKYNKSRDASRDWARRQTGKEASQVVKYRSNRLELI